jgi:hypothetical protein
MEVSAHRVLLEAAPNLDRVPGFAIFGTPPIGFPPAMDRAFLPNPAMADPDPSRSTSVPKDQQAFLAAYESRQAEMVSFLREKRLVESPGGGRERFVMPEDFLQGDDAGSVRCGHLSLSARRKLFEAEQERADDAENHESFHGSISSCPHWDSKRGARDLSSYNQGLPSGAGPALTERGRGGDIAGNGLGEGS